MIRDIHSDMVKVGTNGGCFRVAKLLAYMFSGEIWYDGDHAVTKIGEHLYDITGKVHCRSCIPWYCYGKAHIEKCIQSSYYKNPLYEEESKKEKVRRKNTQI